MFTLRHPSYFVKVCRNIDWIQITGMSHKRSGATPEEHACLDLVAEEPPLVIPGTTTEVLICSDLSDANLFLRPAQYRDQILEAMGKRNLIGRNRTYIAPEADSLVLVSCWAVGSMKQDLTDIERHYRLQLRNIAYWTMEKTDIQELVVVDRVPSNLIGVQKPYNGLLEKVIT